MVTRTRHALVTGATGFVGSRLCKELTKQGYKVTGLSRMPKTAEIDSEANGNVKIINCDVSHDKDILGVFHNLDPVDCIFHLAGHTYRKDMPGPQPYFQNNFMGTLNMLECCRIFNIKKFILSSSIAVYGLAPGQHSPKYLPVDENHDVNPYDYYDLSKCYSEQLCKFYSQRFGIDCAVLRYSRIYGPGTEKAIVFHAMKKAFSNSPIEVLGDISTDFVFVDDAVRANLQSLAVSGFEIFNIGSGQETKLNEICSRIVELTSSRSELQVYSEPKARFSLDISKAKNMLGYLPTTLEEGLITTINYARGGSK